jgi:chromate transporter
MPAPAPSFSEALRFWLKLGLISFGGPAGQIAIMHTELVERKKWIGEQRFLHALNYCMLLPGPEATQLATYCGWLLHRTWGGIAAGALFVLPSAVLLWALSTIYVLYGRLPWIAAIFYGLQPAVIAIVLAATLRIGQRALNTPLAWTLAVAAFAALFFLKAPFPLVIASAAAAGLAHARLFPQTLTHSKPTLFPATQAVVSDVEMMADHARLSWTRAAKVLIISLVIWWLPVMAAGLWQGWHSVLPQQAFFFSKAAIVTFGGAYAVLPYVGQQAIEQYQWLSPNQMLDGLALAETTPGPLIMVLQFVGFLGGWNHPGALPPLTAATLCAAMTTWTTFVPCFLWIFLGAPYIERLRNAPWINHALSAVTAAVVGVILNLALWFALHVFAPSPGGFDWIALAAAAAAFFAMQRFKIGIIPIVLAGAIFGLLQHALTT